MKTTTTTDLFNVNLGEEKQILKELTWGRLTYNEELKQVRLYFENNVSPEDIKTFRETVQTKEEEVENFKRLKEYDIEEYETKLKELKKAERQLENALAEERLAWICHIVNEEWVREFIENWKNCKKRTVWSFAWATGWRSPNTDIEVLENCPIPNTENYFWTNN